MSKRASLRDTKTRPLTAGSGNPALELKRRATACLEIRISTSCL